MASTARRPDRKSVIPLWSQVLDDIVRRMEAGEFADSFPTDRQLIEEYGVSRHTARDAVRRLQNEGILERERGRGSFVRQPAIEQSVGPLYSLFRSVEMLGYEQRSRVLTLDERTDADAAARLGIAATEPLVHLRRLRFADTSPIALDELWLPATIARPLLAVDFEHTALYAELDRLCDIGPESGWERIHPATASTEEAALLEMREGRPVFEVERFTQARGEPLECRRTVIRGDRFSYVTRWSGGRAVESVFSATKPTSEA